VFPQEALARGQIGYVDVDARIDPLGGKAEDVSYRPDRPESAVFVDALKEVLPFWRFRSPTRDCFPTDERISASVSFDLADGKPKIAVSREKIEARVLTPVQWFRPDYPLALLQYSYQPHVYARMKVAPSGRVEDVETLTIGGPAGSRNVDRAVKVGLRKWLFPPSRDSATRVVCYDVDFRTQERE
jgi:outer membrane biosynthesis protein TonB